MKALTLPVRAVPRSDARPEGVPGGKVVAYYGEVAYRHMAGLVRRAADASPEEYAVLENEAHVLHELHAFFPPGEDGRLGIRMLSEVEAAAVRGDEVPLMGHGAFQIPTKAMPQTVLFDPLNDPEPPAWSTPLVTGAPESSAARLADFDGATYVRALDHERLGKQLLAVGHEMSAGAWRTLAEISAATGAPEASVSARLRDLRKRKFGGHTVNRERLSSGLWRYRLVLERFETPWDSQEETG